VVGGYVCAAQKMTTARHEAQDGEGKDPEATLDHKVVVGTCDFEEASTALASVAAVLRVPKVQTGD
jgi:hypothetical protein